MRKIRKTVLVAAAVMFAAGAAIGFTVMRYAAAARPDLYKYKYVSCAVAALLLGAVLALSAKSTVFLIGAVIDAFKGAAAGAKPYNIVSALFGVVLGVLLTWLLDWLIKKVITVITVRIIADVAFCVVVSGLLGTVMSKLFGLRGGKNSKRDCGCTGYVLTGKALGCDGIYEFCRDWLLAPPFVLSGTVSDLAVGGDGCKQALETYARLQKDGLAVTVAAEADVNVAEYAHSHGLKIIAASKAELECCNGVLAFELIGKPDAEGGCG